MQVTAYGPQTVPGRGVVRSCDPLQNFGCSNHITGTAEFKVVKFFTRVGYVNSDNRIGYHWKKGRGNGHVTVLKFCHGSWCSTSCGFVSDIWATCVCWWLCFWSKFVNLAERKLQLILNELITWADSNGFKFSEEKTCVVYFCSQQNFFEIPLYF